MRSLTSLHESRACGPQNSWPLAQNDFCNTIGQQQKYNWRAKLANNPYAIAFRQAIWPVPCPALVEPNLPARPRQGGDADKLLAAVEQPRKLRPNRLECQRVRAVDAEWPAQDDILAMLDPIDAVELGPCPRKNLEIPLAINRCAANVSQR